MKNPAESMPNPSSEPKKPVIQEEDIETLMKSFEDKGAGKAAPAKEPTYEELLEEAEASMNADIATSRSMADKNILSESAELLAGGAIDKHYEELTGMLNRPEDISKLLLGPVTESLRKVLDPDGGFGKKHDNPQVRELYAHFDRKAKVAAYRAVVGELSRRIDAESDPVKISTYHKVLEAVESADPGATKQ